MGGPQLPRVKPGALRLRAPRGSQRPVRMDRIIILEPVPQPRRGRLKIGITAEMKTEQDDRLERRGVLSQPTQRYLDGLHHPRSPRRRQDQHRPFEAGRVPRVL